MDRDKICYPVLALCHAVRALRAIEQGRGACEEQSCSDVAKDALAEIECITLCKIEEIL
jgi:hypothetical protein